LFKLRLQQQIRAFTSALVRSVFVIRTARFSQPHSCVPSHRSKSTGLSRDVEAEAGSCSGPVPVETEAQKFYRFHIGQGFPNLLCQCTPSAFR